MKSRMADYDISTYDISTYDISTYDISTYEYELIKRRDLDYDYMLACKTCLELEAAFCDFQELRTAIAHKVHAKQAYELQENVLKFALYDHKAFIDARNAFRHAIEMNISTEETIFYQKTTFLKKVGPKL
jgi:hypothetical protein